MNFEDHSVTTEDGYILHLFRINDPKVEKLGRPILMLHGIMDTAKCFIFNYPEKAPAVVLARAGYDVWLANGRGTDDSNMHEYLRNDSEAYWNFTFVEIG